MLVVRGLSFRMLHPAVVTWRSPDPVRDNHGDEGLDLPRHSMYIHRVCETYGCEVHVF